MLYEVADGRPPADPVAVTHPAHWRPAAVDALRDALAPVPEFQQPTGVAGLRRHGGRSRRCRTIPGVPTSGVVALCDFGGSGTSITLVDAANGFAPIGPTVRHTDLSGDLIDQALLTHVINDLSDGGHHRPVRHLGDRLADPAARPVPRSQGTVVDRGGHLAGGRAARASRRGAADPQRARRGDPRAARRLRRVSCRRRLERNGIRAADLVAVASVGGGARIPIITTTLSEHFRVPVITTAQPELTAAIGGGLKAARGTVDEGATSMASCAAQRWRPPRRRPPRWRPRSTPQDALRSSTFRALAWSEADDIPDVAPAPTRTTTAARPPAAMGRRRAPADAVRPRTV